MTPRSVGHHQIPAWHLTHFSQKRGKKKTLCVGSKDSLKLWTSSPAGTFRRNDANTRTDFRSQVGGVPEPVKSDKDEQILADFDSKAAPAALQLIRSARQWRGTRDAAGTLPNVDMETCKEIIVVQARRARESQNRMGINGDKSELYYDLYFKLAEEQDYQLPSKESLLSNPRATEIFDVLDQNHRANFASGNHPILAQKETDFLAPLGLRVAVIEDPTQEFVIGSHGITIMETPLGQDTWLPIAPDIAISFSGAPGIIEIGICTDEFVDAHNRAALALSAHVAGHSKELIEELLRTSR